MRNGTLSILSVLISLFILASCITIPPEKLAEYQKEIGKQYWTTEGSGFPLCKEDHQLYGGGDSCPTEYTSIIIEGVMPGHYLTKDTFFAVKNDSGERRYINGRRFIEASKTTSSFYPPKVTSKDPAITSARAAAICLKKGQPKIGMTASQVMATCLGQPNKVNETVIPNHKHEQWVYPDSKYLYFKDGVLTSLQQTK